MTRPLYFDCDTGIDDSLALAYLLGSTTVDLVGIGTVSGNIDAAQAARNTLDLLHLAGRTEIPVSVGQRDHLTGPFAGGPAHIHGHNGIGDIALDRSPAEPVTNTAAEMIIELALQHPGELDLLAVGPLTNLALALRLEPRLPSLVRRVVLMGGAAMVPGNISAVAEANIGNDPEAAAEVFDAAWPIVMAPLDVTLDHPLEDEHRQALLASDRPVAQALGAMLEVYFAFNATIYGRPRSALHDPLAAALATEEITVALGPTVHVEVDATSGPGRGQTICDLRGRLAGWPDQPGAHTQVVLALTDDFAPHLMERLLDL